MYVIMCTNMPFTVACIYFMCNHKTLGTPTFECVNLLHERRGFPGKHTTVNEVEHFVKRVFRKYGPRLVRHNVLMHMLSPTQ